VPSLLLSFQKCLGAQRRLYFCCSGCQESLKVLICKEKKFFFNKKRLSFDGKHTRVNRANMLVSGDLCGLAGRLIEERQLDRNTKLVALCVQEGVSVVPAVERHHLLIGPKSEGCMTQNDVVTSAEVCRMVSTRIVRLHYVKRPGK